MRKIESKEKHEKKQKRNQYILAGVLVLVLFGSVFGIIVNTFGTQNSSSGIVKYKGYTFQYLNGLYTLKVGNSNFYFTNSPNATESIQSEVVLNKTLQSYTGKVLYVATQNFNAYSEIYNDLSNYTLRIQEACIQGMPCLDKTLPTKTCADNVIVITNSSLNSIYQKQNCVYISGNQNDIMTLTDQFLLRILGIK